MVYVQKMLVHTIKNVPKYTRILAKKNFNNKIKNFTFVYWQNCIADKLIQRD